VQSHVKQLKGALLVVTLPLGSYTRLPLLLSRLVAPGRRGVPVIVGFIGVRGAVVDMLNEGTQ